MEFMIKNGIILIILGFICVGCGTNGSSSAKIVAINIESALTVGESTTITASITPAADNITIALKPQNSSYITIAPESCTTNSNGQCTTTIIANHVTTTAPTHIIATCDSCFTLYQPIQVFPSAKSVQYAYVTNGGSYVVTMYQMNNTTGMLTPLSPATVSTESNPIGITVDPSGKFAYVANNSSNSVSMYRIESTTGVLSPLSPKSTVSTGSAPYDITFDPSGKFVYVVSTTASAISMYSMESTTGKLNPLSPSTIKTGAGPYKIAFDPTGRFAYVANHGSNSISSYVMNAQTGLLTPLATVTNGVGTNPIDIVFNPSGNYVYVTNASSSNISVYSMNIITGALAPIKQSPINNSITFPYTMTFAPNGKFAYIIDPFANAISPYTVESTTGVLTVLTRITNGVGTTPSDITFDPSGNYVYVTNNGSGYISIYSINNTNGQLTPLAQSPVHTNPLPYNIVFNSLTSPSVANKLMFITESAYNGNLESAVVNSSSGINSADIICESEAQAAGLAGTYKALLIANTRYPCNATGNCGINNAVDWVVKANQTYANAANPETTILTSNSNGIFENSYSRNLILSANGHTIESALFWDGINGVLLSSQTISDTSSVKFSKWSYANESQNWNGSGSSWSRYTISNCANWTSSDSFSANGFAGDNGAYADSNFVGVVPNMSSDITSGSGYSSGDILGKYPDMSTASPSRWLITNGLDFGLRCDNTAHLICVEQ